VSQVQNEINQLVRQPLCSNTGFLAVWEPSLAAAKVAICCILFTNCCRLIWRVKPVADCSQTVAICCNSSKSLDSVSRRGYGIPVADEGINAAIIGLELPCRAEERGRSGSAHRHFRVLQPAIHTGQVSAGSELGSNAKAVPPSPLFFFGAVRRGRLIRLVRATRPSQVAFAIPLVVERHSRCG